MLRRIYNHFEIVLERKYMDLCINQFAKEEARRINVKVPRTISYFSFSFELHFVKLHESLVTTRDIWKLPTIPQVHLKRSKLQQFSRVNSKEPGHFKALWR